MEARDEADHVAASSTAEAVEEPSLAAHRKGPCLLLVKGAQAEECPASALQLDPVLSDDLGQVVPTLDLVDPLATHVHLSPPGVMP